MDILTRLDYGIIVTYLVLLVLLGLYLRKLASQNLESYFLAGKRLPWWMLGIAGMGYSLDIAGTMLTISLLWLLGPRGLFIEFRGAVSLALLCQMIWTGKWHRRSGCMTVAEWMSFRFGEGRMANFARLATALSFIVFAAAMLTYMAVGVGLFLSLFIPLTPFQCALILISVATLYTMVSGFYGVVVSDLLQCGLILLGAIIVMVVAAGHITDLAGVAEVARSVTGMADWTLSYPTVHEPHMPAGYEQYESLLVYTMVFLVLNKLFIGGFGTGHEPQFFAARNERECGKLSCLWAVLMTFRWPMMIGYAVLGLYLVQDFFPDQDAIAQAAAVVKQHIEVDSAQWREVLARIKNEPGAFPPAVLAGLQDLLGSEWGPKLDLVGYNGEINPERVLPSVLLHRIAGGYRGLILVTLIAASMSTFDMTMNKAAAMFTNDIYRRFYRRQASDRELIWVTYGFCVAMVVLAFALAYNISNINDIWGWITMGLWSGIGMPLLLRFYWWRFNGSGYAAGMFGGLASALGVLVFNTTRLRAGLPGLSEVEQFLILTPISLGCGVLGTYLAPATERSTLEHFYRKTRPFGLWGPLRGVLAPDLQAAAAREHRNDMLALPFGFAWMVSMYLLPMQLMIRDYRAFAVTAVIFLCGVAGLYKFWYKNLPPEPASAPPTTQ